MSNKQQRAEVARAKAQAEARVIGNTVPWMGAIVVILCWGIPFVNGWIAACVTAIWAICMSLRWEWHEKPSRAVGVVLLVLGMLSWAYAFSPNPEVLLTVPGLVCFLALIERARSARQAIVWTWIFGALGIGFGYRWLAPTVELFGGLPEKVAVLTTCLFGLIGTIHAWLFILVHRAVLARGIRPAPMFSALLLVAVETLPIRLFPWMAGHGAVDNPALRQAAEWGGVPAVSFILGCLIFPIYEWIVWAFERGDEKAKPRPVAALGCFLVGVALYGFGALRYDQVKGEQAEATESVAIGIVQSNFGSLDKRRADHGNRRAVQSIQDRYAELSKRAADQGAELIVWPETAVVGKPRSRRTAGGIPVDPKNPVFTNREISGQGFKVIFDQFSEDYLGKDHAFLIGMYERKQAPRSTLPPSGTHFDERYNVAALRETGGKDAPWSVYRKLYLIPFGEYMPLGLPESMLPQKFKMRAGAAGQDPLVWRDLRLVPFICYEGILPDHVRSIAGKDERADILVSLTNDSWFGDTWEPWQHLNFTRFRAVEHRAPLVRATNTGVSAFVDITGDVHEDDILGVGAKGVIVRDVPLVERGTTFYVRMGHHFPLVCLVLYILYLLLLIIVPRKPEPLVEGGTAGNIKVRGEG